MLYVDSLFGGFCDESYENNNCVCSEFPLATDLTVENCWIENSADDPVDVLFFATVKNSGSLPTTQPVFVDFFVDGMTCDEPPLLEPGDSFAEVPPLDPGQTALVGGMYPELPTGIYEPVILVNGFGEIIEANLSNNCCQVVPFVQAQFVP